MSFYPIDQDGINRLLTAQLFTEEDLADIDATLMAAQNLLRFFNCLPYILHSPQLSGSEINKARQIRYWLEHNQDFAISIKSLNLSNAGLTQLPPELSYFTNLQDLNVKDNFLCSVKEVNWPKSLRALDLSENQIVNMADVRLPDALKALNLNLNPLISLANFEAPDSLLILDLNSTEVFDSLFHFRWPAHLIILDLSYNKIESLEGLFFPDNLLKLNLSHNHITDLGNLVFPNNMEKLDLSYNRISSVQSISFPAACKLDLSFNQIEDISGAIFNEYTAKIDLSHNQITNLANVAWSRMLSTLILSYNQISTLDDFIPPICLRYLNLSVNRIARLNRVRLYHLLQYLDLSYNHITELSNFIFPSELERISFEGNPITSMENLYFISNLEVINLRGTAVGYLEDHILIQVLNGRYNVRISDIRHRSEGHIEIEYVSSVSDLARAFHNRNFAVLEDFDMLNNFFMQNNLLPTNFTEQLHLWGMEAGHILEPSLFNSLEEENRQQLAEYLQRLRMLPNYENPQTRPHLVNRIYQLLLAAGQNVEFQNQMLILIEQGLETCGDRLLITFNDLEVLWCLYQEDRTLEKVKTWALGAQKYELLKKYALQIARREELGEEVETVLYICLKLKEKLALPISSQEMLYADMSGVCQSMLDEALAHIRSFSEEKLLASSDFWRNWIIKTYPEESNAVIENYANILEAAAEYYQFDNSEEKNSFLSERDDLRAIVFDSSNYLQTAEKIMELQQQAISRIGLK